MKITLKQLDASWASLQHVAQLSLSAKVSYRLSRILASAESEYKVMRKAVDDLFRKYDAEEKDGRLIITDAEKVAAFQPELDGLMAETVNLWGEPIKIEMLGDAEVSPAVLMPLLDWLIEDEQPEPERESARAATV